MVFNGTTVNVPLVQVVDGDTIKVELPAPFGTENIRILSLDTEEKPGSGGSKPKTPLGAAASARAEQFFAGASEVTLELPGTEAAEIALQKYRGNFGRVLAYVYLDGEDFQETMIREGFSSYFVKYGRADFADNDKRYRQAEIEAQSQHRGVWNQLQNNGEERRNYGSLSTWWELRATLIDRYRAHRLAERKVLNTRIDYQQIRDLSAQGGVVTTLFTEVSRLTTINNGSIGFVDIGSEAQPFTLFLPSLNQAAGIAVVNLLNNRYIANGSDSDHPRRSYLYVTGTLSQFNGEPQMVIASIAQLSDDLPAGPMQTSGNIAIVALLPDPAGSDAGRETVTLRNTGNAAIDLEGWTLRDRANREMIFSAINLAAGAELEIITTGSLTLNNSGDDIVLRDAEQTIISEVTYQAAQVIAGKPIVF